ncbi:hypothetical protein J6590_033324 [Homalodisca vitripennis]|nr:hypothetical protein J6590_033324 [Homalodisca vitripennis]
MKRSCDATAYLKQKVKSPYQRHVRNPSSLYTLSPDGTIIDAKTTGKQQEAEAWGGSLYEERRTKQGSLLAGLYLQFNPPLGREKPMCYLNLGNLMDVQERHITNRKCRDSGVQGQFDRSSILRETTVEVRFLTIRGSSNLNKGVPPLPALTGEAGAELASPSSGGK